jgi:hypothetical protein
MKETHLRVQAHRIKGAHHLGEQHTVRKAQQRVRRIARGSSTSPLKREDLIRFSKMDGHGAKVASCPITLNAANRVTIGCTRKRRKAFAYRHSVAFDESTLAVTSHIPCPSNHHSSTILELASDEKLRYGETLFWCYRPLILRQSQQDVTLRRPRDPEAQFSTPRDCRYANSAPRQLAERIVGDLRSPGENNRLKGLNRNSESPLTLLHHQVRLPKTQAS